MSLVIVLGRRLSCRSNIAQSVYRTARRGLFLMLTAAIMLGAAAKHALAATDTWNPASGNWSVASNWGNLSLPGSGDTALYNSTTVSSTATLDISTTCSTINYSASGGSVTWTIAATNGNTLSLSAGGGLKAATAGSNNGGLTVNPDIIFLGNETFNSNHGNVTVNGNITASANSTLTLNNYSKSVIINGDIGDSGNSIAIASNGSGATGNGGSFTINGNLGPSVSRVTVTLTGNSSTNGSLTLTGSNSFNGPTTVSVGYLYAKNLGTTNVLNAFGSGTVVLSNTSGNATELELRADGGGTPGPINVVGAGATANNNMTVVASGTDSLTIDVNQYSANSGNTFAFGTLSFNGSAALNVTGGNGYSLSFGSVALGSSATFVPTTANLTLQGVSGGYGLAIGSAASGILFLQGTNSYTGGTTISGGVLSIASTTALPGWNLSGSYSVAPGAVLAVSNGIADANVPGIYGTTNFAAGAALGFDTTLGSRTYAGVLADTSNGALGARRSWGQYADALRQQYLQRPHHGQRRHVGDRRNRLAGHGRQLCRKHCYQQQHALEIQQLGGPDLQRCHQRRRNTSPDRKRQPRADREQYL